MTSVRRRSGASESAGSNRGRCPSGCAPGQALAGLCFFIWLELVVHANGGQLLAFTMIGYTVVTLVGMAQYGKIPWRRNGEAFSVWFGLLGRLAPLATVGEPEDRLLHRRPYATGLVTGSWSVDRVAMVAVSTAGIIYDGASQTRPFYDTFGFPDIFEGSILLFGFLGIITALVLAVGRRVGMAGIGAGLVPVALGYLVARYLHRVPAGLATNRGGDLRSIPAGLEPDRFRHVSGQHGMAVDGRAVGHPGRGGRDRARHRGMGRACVRSGGFARVERRPERKPNHDPLGPLAPRRLRRRTASQAPRNGAQRPSQVPLALLMIGLTSLTLWSLGQNLVFIPA